MALRHTVWPSARGRSSGCTGKEGLLADIAERQAAAPVPLAASNRHGPIRRRCRMSRRPPRPANTSRTRNGISYAAFDGNPGFHIYTRRCGSPMGAILFVSCGFVPYDAGRSRKSACRGS